MYKMIELTREKIQDCLAEVTAHDDLVHITAFSAESWLIHYYYDGRIKSKMSGGITLNAYYGYRDFDFKIQIHILTDKEAFNIDVDEVKAKADSIRGELKAMLDEEANFYLAQTRKSRTSNEAD